MARLLASVAPAGEDDLARLGAEERGDPAARLLQRLRRDVADAVQGGGVAELLREVRQHRLDDPRVDGLGALVVGVHDPVAAERLAGVCQVQICAARVSHASPQNHIVASASRARSLSVAAPTILTPSMSSTRLPAEHLLGRLAHVHGDAHVERLLQHLGDGGEAAQLHLLGRARLEDHEAHAQVVDGGVEAHRLGALGEHERRVLTLGEVAGLHVEDVLLVGHGLPFGVRARSST